jgi:hypothetical protein
LIDTLTAVLAWIARAWIVVWGLRGDRWDVDLRLTVLSGVASRALTDYWLNNIFIYFCKEQ